MNVDKFRVLINIIARIRRSCCLLRGARLAVTDVPHGYLVLWIGTLALRYHVVTLVNLHLLHILNARINGVILFLSIGGASNILHLAANLALEIATLIIEMLKHFDSIEL